MSDETQFVCPHCKQQIKHCAGMTYGEVMTLRRNKQHQDILLYRLRAENEKLRAALTQAYEQCAKIAESQRKRLDYELSYTGKEDDLKPVYPAEGRLIAAAIRSAAAAALKETGDE